MPQITKIRIVNFQYNDGNRLIADELYNFEDENNSPSDVLINLANGGGKSVLVQLMMQPVIPKAKVAGRRIESFFRKSTDHCFVAVEWTLDNSKNRLMTGIAMAASDSSSDSSADSDRGFQIKYYTFISDYQNDNDKYSVKNLPLSQRENGRFIPAAFDDVRNLAKKSGGQLERYSSDDSAKWKDRLSQYGIIQDEWRVIEKLNSNEDGLSKFFGNLKTSDAVINELIIPRIEGKYGSANRGEDNSLQTMLLSYANQYSKQRSVIKEREILSGFSVMLSDTETQAETLWKDNDSLEKSIETLFAYYDALCAEIENQKKKKEHLDTKENQLRETVRRIKWEKASYEYYTCEEAFARETTALNDAKEKEENSEKALKEAKKKHSLLECAHYFGKLKELENQLAAIDEEISAKENNSESAGKLASLKYSAYTAIKTELQRVSAQIDIASLDSTNLKSKIENLKSEISVLQKKAEDANDEKVKAKTLLEKQRQDNDYTVEKLDIGVFRMLDGTFREDDLRLWQSNKNKKEKSLSNEVEKVRKKSERLESRKEEIPQLTADKSFNLNNLSNELNLLNDRLSEFYIKEKKVKTLCEKYGLDFSARFTNNIANYLNEQISKNDNRIADINRQTEATNEAIEAIERGTLHIPKTLSNYLTTTGIHFVSVEKYILDNRKKGNLSEDRCNEFLDSYPYAAYGVIVNSDKERQELCSDTDEQWLPAVLPIFTYEDIDNMLSGTAALFNCVAVYSKDYFKDSVSYSDNLRNTLNIQCSQKQMLEERKNSLEADIETVTAFAVYDESYEKKTLSEKEKLEKAVKETQKQIDALFEEQKTIKETIRTEKEKENRLLAELTTIQKQLSDYNDLLIKLKEETALAQNLNASIRRHKDIYEDCKKKCAEKDKIDEQYRSICEKINELKDTEKSLTGGLETVSGAVPAVIIEGEWQSLLETYKALLSAQSEDLRHLNDTKSGLQKNIEEKRKEIQKRNCTPEEYESLFYSEELEEKAAAEEIKSENDYKSAVEASKAAGRTYGQAESSFENSKEKLKEFGNTPLSQNEVGTAFDARIAAINTEINAIEKDLKLTDETIGNLKKTSGKAESYTDKYIKPAKYGFITLENNCEEQMQSITKQIGECEKSVKEGSRQIDDNLKRMSELYGNNSEDVNNAVKVMQELLNGKVSGDRYYTLYEHIGENIHTVKMRISQIDTDLAEFHKTKDDIVHQCVIQGKHLYEGLKKLSGNSKVNVQNKRRQMIKFDIPDRIDENIAKAAIASEIEKGTDEIVAKISDDTYSDSDKAKAAERTVGSKNLLRKYIGSENITLKAYKIDRNPDNSGYRTWEQTQVNNSGAEKFVVYFAVILALTAYTRDGYDSALDNNNSRSVLILDNPFGPISSKHVLEPMFEIARNYKVQMICLSDISKSDIVSCFRLVIRAVVKRFALSNKEQLTHEGNESIEHGYYCCEQLNLF